MTEAELLAATVDLAHVYDWRCAHFRPALTKRGWRTPVGADGAGFPDLLMVRDDRCLAVELKGDKGRLSAEQRDWLAAFARCHRAIGVAVWTPKEWEDGTILRALQRVEVAA